MNYREEDAEDAEDGLDTLWELGDYDLTLRLEQQAALVEQACAEIGHVTSGVSGVLRARHSFPITLAALVALLVTRTTVWITRTIACTKVTRM